MTTSCPKITAGSSSVVTPELLPVISRSTDVYPRNEITRVKGAFLVVLNEYLPFASVAVPLVVPFTVTPTPGIGCLVSLSVTKPLMTTLCA
ncbi:hypothetical protein D3C80_1184720 [compost metagenome]